MSQEQMALTTANQINPQTSHMADEFLTFRLGNEEYGIEILKVQEIRGYDAITQIANAPEFIKGVVNLRGIIVPIIDMRIKFRLGNVDYNQFTVVIILNVAGRVMGIVVDGVSDVITLNAEQMRPAPGLGSVIDTEYIMGLGTVDERMLILIDIEKLMSSSDMGLIEQTIN
jgi:purine-binding chemotaxis protein CheW